MNNIYETPVYYATSSTGQVKTWSGHVKDCQSYSLVTTKFGLKGKKLQTQEKVVDEGKNIGRSNETSHFEQAVKELQSKENRKKDKGYTENSEAISTPILPMLALQFDKRKHNIKYPCYVQPKLDGVRMTCHLTEDNKVEMFSRKGKPFTFMPGLEKDLHHALTDLDKMVNRDNRFGLDKVREIGDIHKPCTSLYLDGELYSEELSFQALAGAVRRGENDPDVLEKIHFVVFDCFDTENLHVPFETRWKTVRQLNIGVTVGVYSNLKVINRGVIHKVLDEDEVREITANFIGDGYEGGIIRNLDGLYKLNHRSADLQKLKTFQDTEYRICGYKQGTGSEEGCVIWTCETDNGETFHVRPKGSLDQRKRWFNNGDEFIGSDLTVRYQELTIDGIPRFPVGVALRGYE